jgi:predicted phosphodiesterase
MKIVIFSDTHLTQEFDQDLYRELKKVITLADQVIINGDFWDGYITTFDSFIKSEWQQLFDLLKSKNTIYIYGNHDPEKFCDERVSFFSISQNYEHLLQIENHTYNIQHGHLIHQSIVTKLATILPHSLVKSVNIWIKNQEKLNTFWGKLTHQLELYLDVTGDQQLQSYVKKINQQNKNRIFVFGHSHTPQLTIENSYLNPGKFTVKTPKFISIEQLP